MTPPITIDFKFFNVSFSILCIFILDLQVSPQFSLLYIWNIKIRYQEFIYINFCSGVNQYDNSAKLLPYLTSENAIGNILILL